MIKAEGYHLQEGRFAITLNLLRILRKLDSLKVKCPEQIIVTSHFQTLVKGVKDHVRFKRINSQILSDDKFVAKGWNVPVSVFSVSRMLQDQVPS